MSTTRYLALLPLIPGRSMKRYGAFLASALATLSLVVGVVGPARANTPVHELSPIKASAAPSPTPAAGAGALRPGGSRAGQVTAPYGAALPPPTNLRQPNGAGDCGNHGGVAAGLVCLAVYGNGGSGLALVWDAYGTAVDGFRLYRIDGGRRPISPQIGANGNAVTVGYVPGKSDSFNGHCFVVTTYKSSNESADSRPFCVHGATGGTDLTLSPDRAAAKISSAGGNTGAFGTALKTLVDPAGLFGNFLQTGANSWQSGAAIVGYEYRTSKGGLGDSYYNTYARSAVHFDTAPIAGRYVTRATLLLAVDYAYSCQGNTPCKTQSSCAVTVAPATQIWWDLTGDLSGVNMGSAETTGVGPGPSASIDVTPIVRSWANGGKNYGFVLIGPNENLGAFTESSCLSKYQNESLHISYF